MIEYMRRYSDVFDDDSQGQSMEDQELPNVDRRKKTMEFSLDDDNS